MSRRMQVNMEPLQSLEHGPYLDWTKNIPTDYRSITVSGTAHGGTAIYDNGWVDANYDFIDAVPAGTTQLDYYIALAPITTGTAPDASGTHMKVTWTDGAAVTGINFLGCANAVVDLAGKSATFDLSGSPTGNTALLFQVNPANGTMPKQVKVFEAANESLIASGKLLDPTFLNFYKGWRAVRLMDFNRTNDSTAVNYSDLPPITYASYSDAAVTHGYKAGMPTAALIEIIESLDCSTWINIPTQFTDAAVTGLLTAIRDGCPSLSPRKRLFIEYGNEMGWNFQTSYLAAQATAKGGAFAGDTYGNKWTGYRMAQVSQIARTVFGSDSGQGKWQGQLATQLGNTAVTDDRKAGVDYFITNEAPAGTTYAKLFSELCVAPYIGVGPSDVTVEPGLSLLSWANTSQATFNQNLYDKLKATAATDTNYPSSIPSSRGLWLSQKAKATAMGLVLSMYEGGDGNQTIFPLRDNATDGATLNQAFTNFCNDPLHQQLMTEAADAFVNDNCVGPSQFVLIGVRSKYGNWGMMQTLAETGVGSWYATMKAWNDAQGYHRLTLNVS